MEIRAEAILLGVRFHGEHGTIVRAFTAAHGLLAGYVRGGRSRALRPVLQPANLVLGTWRARTEAQLPALTVELVHSRAPLFGQPLPAAGLAWATTLTAALLPEGAPHPRLHAALDGLLAAIEAAPAARGWAAAIVRYELLLLAELGFGLDLDACAVTGARDGLVYVSPRSGRAVSAAGAGDLAPRLLPLPRFVVEGGAADWDAILAGLRLTGHFLERDLLAGRHDAILAERGRLVERLCRAVA